MGNPLLHSFIRMHDTMNNYDDYYSKISTQYNKLRLDEKPDFDRTISIIENAYPNRGTLLDIGCGTGKYGEALSALGYTVKGIDKSPAQIVEASKIIDAQIADAVNLPFISNSFDLCLMIMMIHQLDALERPVAFREAFRVLKPGGVLVIKTASHQDIKNRISSTYFPSAYKEDLHRYPEIKTLIKEMTEFEHITVLHQSVDVILNTIDFADKLRERRTSNLRNIKQEELEEGINQFLSDYCGKESFIKRVCNTFLIAHKGMQ